MRILLFGKNGQVGWELQCTLASLGKVVSLGRQEADLADFDGLMEVVRTCKPEVIVNAAAYTDVDGAEGNQELAMRINGEAPGVLAEETKKLGALLIHYSTDYVFDGEKGEPYVERDEPNPINLYGASKLAGEQAIQAVDGDFLTLRTAWVYSLRGDNFVTKVLRWSREQETLRIVDDQISSPTWARMLAEATALILARGHDYCAERKGIYHLAGAGQASRFEWAREILKLDPQPHEQFVKEIHATSAEEISTPALRPLNSALICQGFESAFSLHLPKWESALQLMMRQDV
jgi:dTDP-4-dehydrorhamnose reductase